MAVAQENAVPPITTNKVVRPYKFRREVSYTDLHVFTLAVGSSSTAAPNISTAVEYALGRVRNIVSVIDWVKLSSMPAAKFGVPVFLRCGSRFSTTMSLPRSVDGELSDFVVAIAPEFTALKKRKPYRPFAIALLFRAVIADEMGFLPYKVVGESEECGSGLGETSL